MAINHLVSGATDSSSSHGKSGSHKRKCTLQCREGSEDRSEHELLQSDFQQKLLTNNSHEHLMEISDLPTTIIAEILSKLPLESILASKVVYRSWNQMTRDPDFIKLQLSRSKPLLILQPLLKPMRCLCLVDVEAKEEKARVVPLMRMLWKGFQIMCSHDGLLCMGSEDDEKPDPLYIYNPINRELMLLPMRRSKRLLSNMVVCLGSDSAGRYKILRHYKHKYGPRDSKFEILSLGQSSWRDVGVPVLNWSVSRAIFYNGVFYFTMMKRIPKKGWKMWIVAIAVSDEQVQIIPLRENPAAQYPYSELLVIGRKLFVMEHSKDTKHSWMLVGYKVGELHLLYRGLVSFHKCSKEPCYYEVICKLEGEKILLQHHCNHEFVEFCLMTQTYRGNYFEQLPGDIQFNAFHFKPSFVAPMATSLLG